jgi:HSP20 family protein
VEGGDLLRELQGLRQQMNDMFEEALSRSRDFKGEASFDPPVDVYEEEGNITIRVELPGVNLDEVRLSSAGSTLTIQGIKKGRQETPGKTYHRMESAGGKFHREFVLPEEFDLQEIESSLIDGVLGISVPKRGSKPQKS